MVATTPPGRIEESSCSNSFLIALSNFSKSISGSISEVAEFSWYSIYSLMNSALPQTTIALVNPLILFSNFLIFCSGLLVLSLVISIKSDTNSTRNASLLLNSQCSCSISFFFICRCHTITDGINPMSSPTKR